MNGKQTVSIYLVIISISDCKCGWGKIKQKRIRIHRGLEAGVEILKGVVGQGFAEEVVCRPEEVREGSR